LACVPFLFIFDYFCGDCEVPNFRSQKPWKG
jgi:hypothetical protein